MASKLVDLVKEIADIRGIKWNSGIEGRMRNIERELDKKEIKPEDVIEMLKKEHEIRVRFTREDFEMIEEEIK